MSVWLVRHAKAGSRSRWEGPDDLRPLTRAGNRQAEALAAWLRDTPLDGVLSSPYVRCRETIEPLAHARRLPVGLHDALAEGADLDDLYKLIEDLAEQAAVLCTHGDVVANVLEALAATDVPLAGELAHPKGSVWELEVDGGFVRAGRYHGIPGD